MKDNESIFNQLNGISLLRVTSVTMILIVHFGQALPFPDILHTPIVWCKHGVQMFYLLSGFLIFSSLSKNSNIRAFYKRRFVRIMPIYFVVVLINLILFEWVLKCMPHDTLGLGWWRYFLFLQSIIPSVSVAHWNNISALWTMSAFALFYLVAPFLWKINKRGVGIYLICVCVLYAFSIVAFAFYNNLTVSEELSNSLHYIRSKNAMSQLWIFAVGGAIFILKDTTWQKYFLLMLFALIGLVYQKENVTMVFCFGVMMAAVGLVKYNFSNRWYRTLKTLDEYSFSIYLGHTTMIEFMSVLRDLYHLSSPVVGVCSVIGTIMLIWVLHNLVEKPSARYLSHYK
jgi:peptidoglycan/LPS O-acetylase OafA/YrhL